ncbi:hypothetical protein K523DRAFT_322527 [Schizophyllum commune Tattone D]|nr:hypothetical protein K523DRAFT_322527 [Schizophyllum commune Tattone D]
MSSTAGSLGLCLRRKRYVDATSDRLTIQAIRWRLASSESAAGFRAGMDHVEDVFQVKHPSRVFLLYPRVVLLYPHDVRGGAG